MPEIISDTACLIVMDNSRIINILESLYGKITITEEVYEEFDQKLPTFIKVKTVKNRNYMKILNNIVDIGEASTIALALEATESKIILDDLKARKLAKNLELTVTGTLGVLLKAKKKGIISKLKDNLQLIKSNGFRISKELEEKVLLLAGEKTSGSEGQLP